MTNDILDIIIPVYNEEKFIKECLDSLIPQINNSINVYIINDGSTDNTLNIATQYLSKNIHVISIENQGLASARNCGICSSRGEYIMFVDGDDWIDENALYDILNLITIKNPDILVGLIEGFDTENSGRTYKDPMVKNLSNYMVDTRFLIDNNYKIAPATKYIVKREFINKIKIKFVNILHEDQLWSPIILTSTENIFLYNKYFYKYRLQKSSLSTNISMDLFIDYLFIIDKLYSRSKKTDNNNAFFLMRRCAYLVDKIIFNLDYLNIEAQSKFKIILKNRLKMKEEIFQYCLAPISKII